jgi:hypothetical protein
MKKYLVVLSFALALCLSGCVGNDDDSNNNGSGGNGDNYVSSDDETLEGSVVTSGDASSPYFKLFVLNEGQMGTNSGSLDFLRFKDGMYVRKAFHLMNPDVTLNLGDVANDMCIYGNMLWITINRSGIVQPINAVNEKALSKGIAVPSPRNIVVSGTNAYVTSYSGAVYGKSDRAGAVYRIDLYSLTVKDSLHVGFQPEGLVSENGYLYVANSGGFHTGYDDRITVIDQANFKEAKTIEVAPNLQDMVTDGESNIWVSSFGDYSTIHSGIYHINANTGQVVKGNSDQDNVRVSCMSKITSDGYFYTIGTDDEWNWSGAKSYNIYKVNATTGAVTVTPFSTDMSSHITTPYSICVNPANGDIYIGDAVDYVDNGMVFCFDKNFKYKWQADAGIDPGNILLYTLYYGDYSDIEM